MRKVLIILSLLAIPSLPAMATVGGGEITLQSKGGSVIFSHELHVVSLEHACQDCHPKLYTTSKQHKAVTMKSMQTGASCGACHNGTKAFSVKVKGDCAKCHTN